MNKTIVEIKQHQLDRLDAIREKYLGEQEKYFSEASSAAKSHNHDKRREFMQKAKGVRSKIDRVAHISRQVRQDKLDAEVEKLDAESKRLGDILKRDYPEFN